MKVCAGIDIGTNTILMTIVKGDSSSNFEVLDDMHAIARLGEDVDKTGLISQEAFRRAEIILKDYYNLIEKRKVDTAIAVCTSSMRRAKNSLEITQLFKRILNCNVVVISGEEEAELSYIGTIETPEESMVIDIGGGSTEIIIGNNFQVNYRVSTELGAVRLTETFLKNNPPTQNEIETLLSHIHKHISNIPFGNFTGKVYSVAGTATSLASIDLNLKYFDFDKIHNYILLRCKIKSIIDKLLKMTSVDIENTYNIPQKRADVLPAGALILYEILQSINVDRTIVSGYGLRYGIIKRLLDNKPIKSII